MAYNIGHRFNLNDYIVEDYLCDGGRFSFSIPPQVENYFAPGGSSPPSSPQSSPMSSPMSLPSIQCDSDERVAILIPEDDNFCLDGKQAENNAVSPRLEPLNDIQNILDYPKYCLLITGQRAKTFYRCPGVAAADARHIWKQAHLPRSACIQDIEYLLLDWAFTYAHLEIKDRAVKGVAWLTKSECVCRATWSAFLNWILCACSSATS